MGWRVLAGPSVGRREFGSPYRRARRSREVHSEVREGSGGPPEGPGGVRRPTQWSWRAGKPFWRSWRA